MAISALPTVPVSTMSEGVFDETADAFLGALPTFRTQANALASEVSDDADTAASAASTATTKANEASDDADTAASAASTATTKANEASDSATAAQGYLETFEESYIGQYADDTAANAAGFTLEDGVFYFKNTAPKGLRIYKDSAWDDAVLEITGGFSGAYADLTGKPTLGTAAAAATGDFATAAQGGKADTAVQPARTISAGTGITGGGTLAADRSLSIDKATAANIRAGASDKVVTADGIADALAITTPSGGSNFAPNFDTFVVADWAITSNRTLSNPTNAVPGETRYVFIRASSGTRAITFGSAYKGDLPTLDDVTSSKWYLLSLVAYSSTHIVVASVVANS